MQVVSKEGGLILPLLLPVKRAPLLRDAGRKIKRKKEGRK